MEGVMSAIVVERALFIKDWPCMVHSWSHLIFTITYWNRCFYYLHLTDQKDCSLKGLTSKWEGQDVDPSCLNPKSAFLTSILYCELKLKILKWYKEIRTLIG